MGQIASLRDARDARDAGGTQRRGGRRGRRAVTPKKTLAECALPYSLLYLSKQLTNCQSLVCVTHQDDVSGLTCIGYRACVMAKSAKFLTGLTIILVGFWLGCCGWCGG
jgi:hypothetical protein